MTTGFLDPMHPVYLRQYQGGKAKCRTTHDSIREAGRIEGALASLAGVLVLCVVARWLGGRR